MDIHTAATLVRRMDQALEESNAKCRMLNEKYSKLLADHKKLSQDFLTLSNHADNLAEQVRKSTAHTFVSHNGFLVLTSYQKFKQDWINKREGVDNESN